MKIPWTYQTLAVGFIAWLGLVGCASQGPGDKGYCNVERVAFRNRHETLELLNKHPKWTMDALKTIADLEHEINECRGYQEYH